MSSRSERAGKMAAFRGSGVGEPGISAETSPPQRWPGQQHNRMVCIKAEGKEAVYVDMPGHYDLGSPSLSPDGKAVAFDALTVGEDPARQTWLVGIDGKGLRKVTDAGVPRWSPDGKRVMVTRTTLSAGQIQTQDLVEIDVATGKERGVFSGRFGDWSPDGSRIALAIGGERTCEYAAFTGFRRSSLPTRMGLGFGEWATAIGPVGRPTGKRLHASFPARHRLCGSWTWRPRSGRCSASASIVRNGPATARPQ